MTDQLTKDDVDWFVQRYLDLDDLRDNDDPISDLARMVAMAYELPGVKAIQPDLSPMDPPPEKIGHRVFINAGAEYLHAINPTYSQENWAWLFASVLVARYGRTFVRFRKRPQQAMLLDARFMMPKRLMEKYGISRSYAYQLRKQALGK